MFFSKLFLEELVRRSLRASPFTNPFLEKILFKNESQHFFEIFCGNSRVVFVYTGVIPFSCGIFVNSLITSIVVRKVSFPVLVFSMKLIKSGESLK